MTTTTEALCARLLAHAELHDGLPDHEAAAAPVAAETPTRDALIATPEPFRDLLLSIARQAH